MEEFSAEKTPQDEETTPINSEGTKSNQDDTGDESKSESDDVTDEDTSDEESVKKKKVWPAKYNKGPFICAYCGKKFRGLLDLTRHERTHTNEKPLLCKECGKGFGSDSSLRVHLMVHRNERPHVCPTCKAGFRSKTALKEHTVVHTDLRPHICKVCGKALRQKSSIRKHMRMHTGERPHKCEICGRAFAKLSNCMTHQERHADPNNRVNRIPKEPRIRYGSRGGLSRLPRRVRMEIKRDLIQRASSSHTSAPHANLPSTASVPMPILNGGLDTNRVAFNTSAPAGYQPPQTGNMPMGPSVTPVTKETPTAANVTVTGPTMSSVPGLSIPDTQMRSVVPSVAACHSQVNMAPPVASACPTLPGGMPMSQGTTPVAFDKTGGLMPIQTLTSSSPILVNSEQIVTFSFSPFMVLKTPFGDIDGNLGQVRTKDCS